MNTAISVKRTAPPGPLDPWLEILRTQAAMLDGIDVGMCAFDTQDRALVWNRTFLRLFPEHQGFVHVGEPYEANLRRFYQVRLDAAEIGNIDHYIRSGIERNHAQTQPYEYEHRGTRIQVSSLPVEGLGRVRVWRSLGAPPQDPPAVQELVQFQGASLLESVPEALAVCAGDGSIQWVNAAFCKLFRVDSSPDVLGSTLEEVTVRAWADAPPHEQARRDRGLATLRENLRFPGAAFELPLPGDGYCRVVARTTQGATLYALIDISDLKLYQDALQMTLDNAGRGIVRYNANGRIILYNRAALELLELPEDMLQGAPRIQDVFRFQEQRGDLDFAEIRDYGPPDTYEPLESGHYTRPTRSGKVLEVETRQLPDGGAVRTYSDVTAYVEARRSEEEKTRALEITLDSMSQGISALDAQGRLVMWNRRYGELLQLPAELLARQPTMEDLVRFQIERGDFGENFQFVDALARGYVAVGDKVAPLQGPETYSRKTTDGRTLEVVTRPLPDGGVVRTFTDITVHEQTQAALLKASQEALEASQAKSRFLSSMSHEIRTPMNAVLGMLTLLRGTELTVRQRDYADKAESAATALLGLLNDILDFSKIEAGKMRLVRQPFSLTKVFSELSVVLASNVGDRKIDVRYDLDARVPDALVGDDMRLRQMLINLGGNAVKFTERGEVVLATRLVSLDAESAQIEFSVRDTGIGISPEQQERLFDDYMQGTDETSRRYGGTGLGLGICRRLAQLMDSHLQLSSTPGEGSRFWFTLQLPVAVRQVAPAVPAPTPAPAVSGNRPLEGMRLLLAEDNAINQQIAVELLSEEGARIDVVENGAEAVERLKSGAAYDLVLMDVQMPVMDGLEATREIRKLHTPRTLPIVAMTANAMDSDRRACMAAGMNAHVAKPFSVEETVRTILRHVHGGRRTFDRSAALEQLGGDETLLASVLPVFKESLLEFAQVLASPGHGSAASLAQVMHTIRGMAGNMAATGLASLAEEAESQLVASAEGPEGPATQKVAKAIEELLASLAQEGC